MTHPLTKAREAQAVTDARTVADAIEKAAASFAGMPLLNGAAVVELCAVAVFHLRSAIAHADTLARERDEAQNQAAELRSMLDAESYADAEIRRTYAAEFGIGDPDDSPPCWDDFADHLRATLAELTRLREVAAEAARWLPPFRAEPGTEAWDEAARVATALRSALSSTLSSDKEST